MQSWFVGLLLLISASALHAAPMRVFVSVLPQRLFVERIGGDGVQVEVLVGPGVSPDSFEPKAQQVVALAESQLFVRAGMPFEEAWLPRVQRLNPRLQVLDLREGAVLHPWQAGDHSPDHSHQPGETDPHLWTDPQQMRRHSRSLADRLIALLPEHREAIELNWKALDRELAELDASLHDQLAGLRVRAFLVFHPAWGYFAERYDLQQVAIQQADKEPGPRQLAELISQARRQDLRLLVAQPQYNPSSAEILAREMQVRLVQVDPLDPAYFPALRQLANALQEANQ